MSGYYDDHYSRRYSSSYADPDPRDRRTWDDRGSYHGWDSSHRSYSYASSSSSSRRYEEAYDSRSRDSRQAYPSRTSTTTSSHPATPSRASREVRTERPRQSSRHDAPSHREQRQSNDAEHERRGIKNKDMGFAFLAKDDFAYLKTQLKSQLRSQTYSSAASTAGDGNPAVEITPRLIVDESMKLGHFDSVRKQLLLDFQKSEFKQPFLDKMEAYLLTKLEDMSSRKRQRFAAQDQRLQHSEVQRWIEEGRGSADLFDRLFNSLRGAQDASTSSSSSKRGILESKGTGHAQGIFDQQDGKLDRKITSTLRDMIHTERQRVGSATGERETDDEESSTPLVKSSVTPLGRETPLASDSGADGGSGGHQTPLPAVQSKQQQ